MTTEVVNEFVIYQTSPRRRSVAEPLFHRVETRQRPMDDLSDERVPASGIVACRESIEVSGMEAFVERLEDLPRRVSDDERAAEAFDHQQPQGAEEQKEQRGAETFH